MRTITKTNVMLPALLVALVACGSKANPRTANPSDALVGEWNGTCSTTRDQDGSKIGNDVNAKIRFTQEGKYFRSSAGHHGGEVTGDYTVAGQTITVTSDSGSIKIKYSINDGILTTNAKLKLPDTLATSTCNLRNLRQGAGG